MINASKIGNYLYKITEGKIYLLLSEVKICFVNRANFELFELRNLEEV